MPLIKVLVLCFSLCCVSIEAFSAEGTPLSVSSIEISIKQRTVKPIRAIGDNLYLSVGDVTRGQVMTAVYQSVIRENGSKTQVVLLKRVSMKIGTSQTFHFQGHEYVLRLKGLNNVLIGDDMAIFELSRRPQEMGPQQV